MSKATDKELGELHLKLAKAMSEALDASYEAQSLLDATCPDDMPQPIWDFLVKTAASNPALLTAVAKFLKDNDITCAIDDSKELTELQERLKAKRKHSVDNVVPINPELVNE